MIKTNLDSKIQTGANVHGGSASNSGVLVGVDIQHVSGLSGELNSTGTVCSASLHKEGVVVLNNLPDQSGRHFPSIYNHCNKV